MRVRGQRRGNQDPKRWSKRAGVRRFRPEARNFRSREFCPWYQTALLRRGRLRWGLCLKAQRRKYQRGLQGKV